MQNTTVEIVKTATEYTVFSNGTKVGKIIARKVGNRVVGYTYVPALGMGCPITIREGDDRGGFKLHTLKTALIGIKTIAMRHAQRA
jgi:hypothetical protein